jgi:hypothetical protein
MCPIVVHQSAFWRSTTGQDSENPMADLSVLKYSMSFYENVVASGPAKDRKVQGMPVNTASCNC